MKNSSFVRFILFMFMLFTGPILKAQSVEPLESGKPTSIRGLSVVDDHIAWASGSKGFIATTVDGGKTWAWQQVKGFEKADFRDIEAFSDKEAIIMSSGTPALILKTIDGGQNWQVKYLNTDTSYFFDAMDFADKRHGYVLGDPIHNKFVLIETRDGGETWNPFKCPPASLPGEAAFAASGTCLRVEDHGIGIVTGGSYSRKLTFDSSSPNIWLTRDIKIKHGKPSQGAFSIANGGCIVIVGGDYQNDRLADSVTEYYCYDGTYIGGSVALPKIQPSGFQSCVEFISENTFLSTGTPGSNITTDGGKTWRKIDNASYNVCRKAKRGNLVLLAGNDGKIGILKR